MKNFKDQPCRDIVLKLRPENNKNRSVRKRHSSNGYINIVFSVAYLFYSKSKQRQNDFQLRLRRSHMFLALGLSPFQAVLKSFQGRLGQVVSIDCDQ